jgi:hypothetical protein
MKQLSEIQSNAMFVQPKLPTFQIVINDGSQSASVDYDALYQAAYNKLTSAEQTAINQYLSQATKYGCYPCSPADANSKPTDWYNFVKYCVMTGNKSTLDTYALTWSATGSGQSMTYTPNETTRKAALTMYNNYVNDAGKTTGTKPQCTTVDVNTAWTNNTQTASRV